MDSIVFTYHPERNPGHPEPDAIPGVPLRDLTAADLAALPAHLQASVAACPFYTPVDAAALPALDEATPEEG